MTAIVRNVRGLIIETFFDKPERLVLAPVVAGLVFRLHKAWDDIPTLVLQAMSDDAFYYFKIARNIATGHNVTFDGETLTNGFHPLWMAILTPIYLLGGDRDLSVHLGLTIASLLAAGTVFLVYAIARTLTDNLWASLAAATVYALHPYLIVEALNGMETALTVFMVALTTWLFLRIAVRSERTSLAGYAGLGASAGLMVLARTDTVFILPPVLLFLLARERGWQRLTSPLVTGGLALVVVAPWAIWSLVTFGTVVQVSGVAVADVEREAYLDVHGSSVTTQVDRAWDVTSDALFAELPHLYFVPHGGPKTPILFTGLGFLALMLVAPFAPQRGQATRQIGLLTVPTLGIVASLVFNGAIRWHVRVWYLAPMALVGAIFLAIVVNYVHGLLRGTRIAWRSATRNYDAVGSRAPAGPQASRRRRRRIPLAIPSTALYVLIVAGLIVWYGPQRYGSFDHELRHRVNMLEAARWLEENTDSQARIGSLNAGIIGYFSDRTVINLDGVVNEEAYEARRDGRLLEYVLSKEICYLADLQDALAWVPRSDDSSPGFELVTTIGQRLGYFGGGQLDVLEAAAPSYQCGEISGDSPESSGLQDSSSGEPPGGQR
jgi:4-amino-4-deoxy-L-arabinose transferase-like glycosyltransferase